MAGTKSTALKAATLKPAPASSSSNPSPSNPYTKLNESIKHQYYQEVQTKRVYEAKQQAIQILEQTAKNTMIGRDFDLKIWLTGSSVNGFGNKNSDADMCLVTYSKHPLNRKTIINLLHQVRRKLCDDRRYLITEQPEVIPAKVPILRVFLNISAGNSRSDREMKVQCDINVDNHIGIRNSWLLRCYSELDPRIREFIYVVKKFAKAADLNDASGGSLSTYSWLLLSIHFLQTGVKPAVLPIVQQEINKKSGKIFHEHFAHDELEDVSKMALLIKTDLNFKSENTMSVGELFQRWLTYFALSYNFKDFIISIRCGKLACRFGQDSIKNLSMSIADSEREIKAENMSNLGKNVDKIIKNGMGNSKDQTCLSPTPRKRTTSGVFVKKSKTSSKDDSENSESEEKENKGSIVIKSSDEDSDSGEITEKDENNEKDEEIEIIESDDDSGCLEEVDDQQLYDQAKTIFGSIACADIIHPKLAQEKAEKLRISQLTQAQSKSDIYKSLTDRELVLSQRKLIKNCTTMDIDFKVSDYPLDRIVICIEEPFQRDNVARAVYDKEKAVRIIRTLRFCRERFEEVKEKESEVSLGKLESICKEYLRADKNVIIDTIKGKRRKRPSGGTSNIVSNNEAVFVDGETSESDSDDYDELPPAKRPKLTRAGSYRGKGRGGRGRGRGGRGGGRGDMPLSQGKKRNSV